MFERGQSYNLFHGARMVKGNIQTNEVITSTFDPATLNCLVCPNLHPVLSKSGPVAICFTDQNFVPSLSGTGCVAVLRYEDASLAELSGIALEILEKNQIHPGSVLLFGSMSHLFKVGASCYVADWVSLLMRIETRYKNVNVCPLVPIIQTDTVGSLVRDIEILATWFHKVYASNIKGLLDTWSAVTHYVQASSCGQINLPSVEIQKVPLPANLVTPQLQPTYFKFDTSSPAKLTGMSNLVSTELIRIILTALQSNFSIAVGPEVILPRSTTAGDGASGAKHVICIGSSIVKQLVPYLQAAGYTVTDLSQPGWLATAENIDALIAKMSELRIAEDFCVLLDLFSNCSHRYQQFDGTQSLAQKEGGKYHMPGPVVTCNDDTFRKIIKMLAPVLLSAQNADKILIPPLPRYLFTPCCSLPAHCTNFHSETYAENALGGLSKLRNILKKECASMGVRNVWVLDGIGALLGTPPGESYGTNREILSDLRDTLAKDGVHLERSGNIKVTKSIGLCFAKLRSGKINDGTFMSSPVSGRAQSRSFYWRGFSSPVGDLIGRTSSKHSGKEMPNWKKGRKLSLPYERPPKGQN
jgi:hypothetical protein